LFDSMNVYDNIAFPLREARWSEQEVAARIPEVLALVDLDEDVAGQMPDALSGGMQKRVALARAIAVEPRAILYDEPTTGLDPVTANTINDLIRSMQQRLGVTSVVVTHDIQSAFRVGDRIAFLYQGRIRFLGTVRQARETDDPVLAAFIAGRSLEEGRSDA
ncbi:MAG TPA: ATP-binding cassette domain-containing protein, partial [Acidobacteria bacterium]|nr:ATP-binding cassette domain-containing protein [Acidobacteriota bacterium]